VPLEPKEAAKQASIAYRQLGRIMQDEISAGRARVHLARYNGILDTLHACFSIDPTLSGTINHLEPLRESTPDLGSQMESDGRVLLDAARHFIELYLSPEDKQKSIGFGA